MDEKEFWAAYVRHGQNAYSLAKELQLSHSTVAKRARRLRLLKEREVEAVHPVLPDGDVSVDELRAQLSRRFEKRAQRAAALRWYEIALPDDRPYGLMLWGDPHLDNNGCNWPLLEQHVKVSQQPGIWSVNLGDVLDNWPNGSRLVRLYAHSDQSVETASRLADWFLNDAGIRWLVHVLGNHDVWPGNTDLKALSRTTAVLQDHGLRFKLKSGASTLRIWAQHDFPGHSMWNSLHGNQRAAQMREQADLYVSGHKHTWALHQEELADRNHVFWAARARGYKFLDDYAEKLGYDSQREGASILAVVNPTEVGARRMHLFADVALGADFLKFLRAAA